MSHRYKLVVEYDGGPFQGWQYQPEGEAVENYVRAAILAFCGELSDIAAAGRTDAGVHARGQVIHIDLPTAYPNERVRAGLNFHLKPHPICVLEAQAVDASFHARFSARSRSYCYRILTRRSAPTIERDYLWWVPQDLDIAQMQAAASKLIGHHDFTTFRSVQCQSTSPVKTLSRLEVHDLGAGRYDIHATAPSFLHRQVRSLVGALKVVGAGKWTPDDAAAALAACDRAQCPPVAPAHGLYFMHVDYDEK